MKKLFVPIIYSVLAISILSACSRYPAPGNTVGSKIPRERLTQSDSASPISSGDNIIPDKSSFIGEDRAKEIALEKAGISADGVFFERVELDRDGGLWQYEVEFRKDRTEYDADIKADDGTVLSFESDFDD